MSTVKLLQFPISDEGVLLSEINTTPLIDVLLVLLIMLIITLPPLMHSVNMDMPGRGQVGTQSRITIEIDFDGTLLWDDVPLTGLAQLESRLQAAAHNPQPIVQIKVHPRARYDGVAHVLAATQRSGIRRMGFVDNERFNN